MDRSKPSVITRSLKADVTEPGSQCRYDVGVKGNSEPSIIWDVTETLLCILPAVRPPLRTSTISTTRLASTALSLPPFMWRWAPCLSARCVSTSGRSTWWHKAMQLWPDLWPRPPMIRPRQQDRLLFIFTEVLCILVWGTLLVRQSEWILIIYFVLCSVYHCFNVHHSVNMLWKWPNVNLRDVKYEINFRVACRCFLWMKAHPPKCCKPWCVDLF